MPTYTEPEWGTPQEAVDKPSSLCTTGPRGMLLTGILVKLLQYHFHDPDNIDNPILRCYQWQPGNACYNNDSGEDTSSGGIWIGPGYSEDSEGVQASPAIYVKREGTRNSQISQKNISVPSLNAAGLFPGTLHQVNVEGVHSIILKAKTGAAASALGEEVFLRFLHYQSVIRDDFKLGKFFTTSLSEVKEIAQDQEADSGFYTVVRIEWAYVYRWYLRREGPKIKRTHFLYELC
jgi:hypothetical protein